MSCFPPEGTRRLTIFSFRNIRQTTTGLENHFKPRRSLKNFRERRSCKTVGCLTSGQGEVDFDRRVDFHRFAVQQIRPVFIALQHPALTGSTLDAH
jgi:hypothetical protein